MTLGGRTLRGWFNRQRPPAPARCTGAPKKAARVDVYVVFGAPQRAAAAGYTPAAAAVAAPAPRAAGGAALCWWRTGRRGALAQRPDAVAAECGGRRRLLLAGAVVLHRLGTHLLVVLHTGSGVVRVEGWVGKRAGKEKREAIHTVARRKGTRHALPCYSARPHARTRARTFSAGAGRRWLAGA